MPGTQPAPSLPPHAEQALPQSSHVATAAVEDPNHEQPEADVPLESTVESPTQDAAAATGLNDESNISQLRPSVPRYRGDAK